MYQRSRYLIVLVILTQLLPNPTLANVLEVGADHRFSTIKLAIAHASGGDTIMIHPGRYQESNIVVDKCLDIIGLQYPIIDGGGDQEIIIVESDGVTLEGLQIENVRPNYLADHAGIRLKKVRFVTVRKNRLINTFFGIYLEHCADIALEDNEVVGNAVLEMSSGNAIHMWYCKRIYVANNQLKGHRDGIYLEFVEQSTVLANISEENIRYGLHFMFSNHDSYYSNTFRKNGAGVAVMFSKFIDMYDNTFVDNWGEASYGLLLKEIYDAEIYDNIFDRNCIAIFVEGSSRISYQRNTFKHNGWALKMSGGCLDNKVVANSFLNNAFDVAYHGTTNENSFDGNYWSSYHGYDLDHNNIGDVPYRPVKLFNFIVDRTPEAIVLLRSLFIDIVNFAEKVNPLYTPKNVIDHQPLMQPAVP